ncbi:hypothetical protein TNCV_3492411 [Trichonephila clavipes]|nr:hypothetical protein TNCV_3492411 [Trichonephila clavipes]
MKISVSLNCPLVSLKEFFAIDADNACTAPIMAGKNILEFAQSSKNIIEADSDDEKETNKAVPLSTSPEMRNIMKSMRRYLDAYCNGEMNNKMDEIEQFVKNLILKKIMPRKTSYCFLKTQ